MDNFANKVLERRWAAVAAFIVLLAIYMVSVQLPARVAALSDSYSAWQHARGQVLSAGSWDEDMKHINTEREVLQERSQALALRLSGDTEMSAVVAMLNERAAAASITLSELRPLEREHAEAYDRIPIQLKLGGRFHGIGQFVQLAEASEYVMKVRRLVLTGEGVAGDHLQAELLIEVIMLKS